MSMCVFVSGTGVKMKWEGIISILPNESFLGPGLGLLEGHHPSASILPTQLVKKISSSKMDSVKVCLII